jgi:putative membrane protein
MTAEEKEAKRLLVLCVDSDDDIGAKTEIKTPIIGREENLNAAVALALKDPEEPDANAMFEAIRVFNRIKEEGRPNEILEIATISGSELGGVGADRKIVTELNDLLASFPASEVILVTDGYSDEAILPLVESRVPVSSVRRIVVKHSESIEETAALFTRYLRILFENPRYSRIALGIPGLLFIILGIFSMLGMIDALWIAFIIVLGAILLVKGFGVDKTTQRVYRLIREYSPPPLSVQISNFSAIVGILCIIVGSYLGWTNTATNIIPPQEATQWLNLLPRITGHFIQGSINLIVVGICVILMGRSIHMYFERDIRLLHNSALIVLVGWSRWILEGTAKILINPEAGQEQLVFSIMVGILIGIASTLIVLVIRRSAVEFFQETEEQNEDLEEG